MKDMPWKVIFIVLGLVAITIASIAIVRCNSQHSVATGLIYSAAKSESPLWPTGSYDITDHDLGIRYLLPKEWSLERVIWENGEDDIQINTMKDKSGFSIKIDKIANDVKDISGKALSGDEQIRYYFCGERACDLSKETKQIQIDGKTAFTKNDMGVEEDEVRTVLTGVSGSVYRFILVCKFSCDADNAMSKFFQGIHFRSAVY